MLKKYIKIIAFSFFPKISTNIYLKLRRKSLNANGIEVINEIMTLINKDGGMVFADYGTLLGIVRNKGILSWDDDIDLGIHIDKEFTWLKLEQLMESIGFKKCHQFTLDGNITEQNYIKKFISVDFFNHVEHNGKSISYSYDKQEKNDYPTLDSWDVMKIETCEIDKVKNVDINGNKVYIPYNSEEYLSYVYGNDWMIPNPNWISGSGPATTKLKGKYGLFTKFI